MQSLERGNATCSLRILYSKYEKLSFQKFFGRQKEKIIYDFLLVSSRYI